MAFTSYDLVYAMTGGGPGTATTLLSFQIWKESFRMYNFGNGAAVAFITVLISLGFIFAIVRRCRRTCSGRLSGWAQVGRVLLYLAALVLFLFSAGPVFLSLLGSVIPDQALFSFPPDWFGRGFTLDNYRYIFTGELPRQLRGARREPRHDLGRRAPGAGEHGEQRAVALGVMAVNIVLGAPAAYAFARMRFRGRTTAFMTIVMSRLVPAVALTTPFYLLIQAMGLLGTKTALVLVHSVLTLPFTVLILSVFFRRIPQEIEDAAIVDGCCGCRSSLAS